MVKKYLRKLGISEKYLPRVVQPYEVVSHLSEAAAAFCSLRSGIPLVAGAGDKIAGCVGSNILAPGKMIFEDASFGGLSFCTGNLSDRSGKTSL